MHYSMLAITLQVDASVSAQFAWNNLSGASYNGGRQDGIFFHNHNTGWAVNNSGWIFKTLYSSNTLEKIDSGTACNKIRIYRNAAGKLYGYAIGVDVLKAEF